MSTEHTNKVFETVSKPRVRAVIKNSAGKIIFNSAIDRSWEGYIVRGIEEIRDGNDNPPSTYREFSGTYTLTLVGAGEVKYTLTDNQVPPIALCMIQKPGKQLMLECAPDKVRALCFHDNTVEFYD